MRNLLGWTINLIIPALGLYAFNKLRLAMRGKGVESPPTVYLFVLFATYGGWVMVVFTLLLWYWSGMASLGLAYLTLAAPPVTLVMAAMLYGRRNLSIFHKIAFLASTVYAVVVGISIIVLIIYKALFAR